MKVGDLVKCYLRDLVGVIVEVKNTEDGGFIIHRVRFSDGNTWSCNHHHLEKLQ